MGGFPDNSKINDVHCGSSSEGTFLISSLILKMPKMEIAESENSTNSDQVKSFEKAFFS